jgi:SAM-dependent methyltransferase
VARSTDDERELLRSQREYYERRAPDYMDPSRPDRRTPGEIPPSLVVAAIDDLAPFVDVLELACGPGTFTAELARHTGSIVAVDASRAMLARNRARLADRAVRYVEADVFEWEPRRSFDLVFFGFWVSHVPPGRFDEFWARVRRVVGTGRVAFVDEDDRADERHDVRDVSGLPTATRTLRDGRTFDIVKVLWSPAELEARLESLGWKVTVERFGDTFLRGVGTPRRG